MPFLAYLKKRCQNLYFWPRNLNKCTKIWAYISLLLENALILCNPRDEKGKLFAA